MKKLILLTTLLLAFACSKDDESGETFLDKYDGTSWAVKDPGLDGGGVEIITFSNGTYFYNYAAGGGAFLGDEDSFACLQYKEGTNLIFGLEVSYKIQKNEADELLFEAENLGTIKFTPQGENLLVRESTNEEGVKATTIWIISESSYSDYCN
tara:strand:+ start:32 stop:490 length:459 start_codon:yes stop_codon:yes gene_type:complete